jgi:sugar phosphate isomerase/epimerase
MQSAQSPHVGLVWDIVNMWSVTKEPPSVVYEKLKNYIHHTHIKDLKIIDGKEHYVLLGKGESPIFEAIDILAKNNYKGYYSFVSGRKCGTPKLKIRKLRLPIIRKQ